MAWLVSELLSAKSVNGVKMESNGEAFVLDYAPSSEGIEGESGEEVAKKSRQSTSMPRQNGDNDDAKNVSCYNISKLTDDASKKLNLLTRAQCHARGHDDEPECKQVEGDGLIPGSNLMNGCDYVNGFAEENLKKVYLCSNKSKEMHRVNNVRISDGSLHMNKESDLSIKKYLEKDVNIYHHNASILGSTSQLSCKTSTHELDDDFSYNCASQSSCITDVHSWNPSQTHQKEFTIKRTNNEDVSVRKKDGKSPASPLVSEACFTPGDYSISDEVTTFENIEYVRYESELQMPDIMRLIQKDLSEPYSIYTYRYFIHTWPELCFRVSSLILITYNFNCFFTVELAS